MNNNTLGERVKALRKKFGMTQIDLAYRVYISESYIALIEAGKRNPSTDVINALSDVFNVSVDYLVNGEPTENDSIMIKEWTSLIKNRSSQEIEGALSIVKTFFECIDKSK